MQADGAATSGSGRPPLTGKKIAEQTDSLAAAFATAISDASRLTGTRVKATALGNVLIQARTHGLLDGDLGALRGLLRRTQPITTYLPEHR